MEIEACERRRRLRLRMPLVRPAQRRGPARVLADATFLVRL